MPNELVLVNNQQKTFLDELILIFVRRITPEIYDTKVTELKQRQVEILKQMELPKEQMKTTIFSLEGC